MDKIKHFHLKRHEDVSGTSGVGIVARGVVLPSGAAVLEWTTFHSSICIYKNIEDVEKIHGHDGKTEVVIGDPEPVRQGRKRKVRSGENSSES